jgi:23S rRNA (adenine2503-C2)-methyltransferase
VQPLLGQELADLRALIGPYEPAFRAQQLYDAIYRQRLISLDQITAFPKSLRTRLLQESRIGYPEQQSVFIASDGTKRYLLKLDDGSTVETVLMPEGERQTICISSQVGCPVNCQFCLTALMGLERNLTAGEIVGQVLFVMRDNDLWTHVDRVNIVMMGMGEPLLNLPHVMKAGRLLLDPNGLNFSPRRITVSTSGITPKIIEFAAEPRRPKLAISLNASHEEQRIELMPITKKYRLDELIEVCQTYPLRPWEKLSFEYVLLADVNDSDADARRVRKLLANINCKVNLIALNPGPGIDFKTPSPERVQSFLEIVKQGMPCFVRKPRGRDIYAACGQLKRTTELVEIGG